MTQQIISNSPGAGTPAPAAATIVNSNFAELYARVPSVTSPDNSLVVTGSPGNTLALQISGTFQGAFNVLPGVYTYATLPAAVSYPNKYAVTTDLGPVFSNGVIWAILFNPTQGSIAISTNSPVPQAQQSSAYSDQLTATSAIGATTWSLVQKTGTNTWAVSSSGVLTGTPSAIETDYLVVQVSDSTGAVAQKTLALQTVASLSPAATPTFSPVAGTYTSTQSVTISCSTGSSTIYYTTNGSTPTTGSTVYTTPVSVSSTQTIKAIATAGGFTQSAVGSAAYTINTQAYLGVNLNSLGYYNPEQPFTNLLNGAGSNTSNTMPHPWFTSTSGSLETNEEPYLVTDADGYATTLVAGNGIPGGQTFTRITTLMNFNLNKQDNTGVIGNTLPNYGAGTPNLYPTGSYTFQFKNPGTFILGGDATSVTYASGGAGNVVVAGNTITSTLAANAQGSVTFSVTTATSAGISLAVTAIPDTTNYPKAFVICQTSLLTNYNTGTPQYIFHPNFLNALTDQGAGGYQRIRFLDWLNTVQCVAGYNFTGALSASVTTATLNANFNRPNGIYQCMLGDNNGTDTAQMAYARLTFGSTAVTFVTSGSTYSSYTAQAITYGVSAGAGNFVMFIPQYYSWAQRPLTTNLSFAGGKGAPIEICCYLCNAINNADGWFCAPAGMNTYFANTAFFTSWSTLIKATLNGKAYYEYANEAWNTTGSGQLTISNMIGIMGQTTLSSIGNTFQEKCEMYGVQVGTMSALIQTVYGGTFATNAVVSMGGQDSNGFVATVAMNAAAWVALGGGNVAPYTQGIGALHVAPYWLNITLAADQNAILGAGTQAQQLTELFSLAYSNVGSVTGHTYSFASNGWLGSAITLFQAQTSGYWSGQPWGSLPVLGYEGGQNFNGGSAAWVTLFETANRDIRMGYCYYDPTSQLSTNPGFLPAIKTAGMQSFNYFASCNSMASDAWGALENTMETTLGSTGYPPKYKQVMAYI